MCCLHHNVEILTIEIFVCVSKSNAHRVPRNWIDSKLFVFILKCRKQIGDSIKATGAVKISLK